MTIRTFDNIDVRGKYVLLRDEFNVQIVDGKITDTFRIEQSMPTIRKLRDGGARIVIAAHLGRPKGEINTKFSLALVAKYLDIPLIPDCLDRDFMQDMKDGDMVLLENVRFYPGEENNDPIFAEKLASGFDLFINDAFGVSHRAHASTVGVTKFLPSYAGELLASEIKHLLHMIKNPLHPLLAIIAGSKISTKIDLLKSLVKLSDKIIVGGAIGTTFNFALGKNVGNSLYEADQKEIALEIMELAKQNNCEILLTLDVGVAKEFKKDAIRTDKTPEEIQPDDIIMDAGQKTIERNTIAINNARTVIWNGSVGVAEWEPTWSKGSFAIARDIARQTAAGALESFIGGGDTVAVLERVDAKGNVTYASTGGGAFLEFIEGRKLPGIEALQTDV